MAMISLRSAHVWLTPRKPIKHSNRFLRLCKPTSDSESEDGGDKRKQELLARIAMLQTQKVRMTDYIDETAANLTQFAEEASEGMDKVGEDALKKLEEASSRIMENVESKMLAFEESEREYKMEIEKNDKKLADFEEQMMKDRNIGMFFPGAPPMAKSEAKEEAQKIKDLAEAESASKVRKNIYLALIGLLVVVISDGLLNSSSWDWKKAAVFGAILLGLIAQYIYEHKLSLDVKKIEKDEER